MCRIAGIVSLKNSELLSSVKIMTDAMKRGGPDDEGFFVHENLNLALGHRRLSLIDLSETGHQPMYDVSKNIVIVFNGEIYNFQEIKNELIQKGFKFYSSSDTEVIINAYIQWGLECFKKLNGMFAIALMDKRINKLFLVRDYVGIKPLYYHKSETEFIFASEVKAFLAYNTTWPENEDWKKHFLLFGYLPEPVTTLKNVQPLEKGTILELDISTLNAKTHNFFKHYYNYTIYNEDEAIERVRTTLTKAVKQHLISDAPIGLFLSGGIDSSLLTILAKPHLGDNLKTLSIIFEDDKFSEEYYQQIIINETKAQHQSFLISQKNFYESLPDILQAMDQPSCDGINTYFISKKAKKYGLKAVLSGLGADELFGGYLSFYRTNTINSLKSIPNILLSVAGIFPDDKRKRLSFLKDKSGLGEYLFNRGFYTTKQIAALLQCNEQEIINVYNQAKKIFPTYLSKLNEQEKISYLETNYYMQSQLLKDTDYMSMWHSVEVRVPFLDKELLQLTYSIHPDIRYNKNQKKHLLIKAFEKELPKEIWNRKKQGFLFPFENWIENITPVTNRQNVVSKQLSLLHSQKLHWSRYWNFVLAEMNSKKELFISNHA